MWILPKQIQSITSASVLDTKVSDKDCEEFSQICERSLSWRGKDSLSPTWLRRWKRVSWMRHLSTRTLRPSHTGSFEDAWTSSLADSRANHSALLASVKQLKTQDTSSPSLLKGSESANLELFSSRTWLESSQPKPGTESQFSSMSSESWKDWVTEQRLEYSQRKKSAHLTNAKESTSWGTPQASDHIEGSRTKTTSNQKCLGRDLNELEEKKNWATPQVTDAQRGEMIRTPEQLAKARSASEMAKEGKKRGGCRNLREDVMQPQNWPTARTSDAEGGRIQTEMTPKGFKSKRHKSNQTFGAKLRDAVETYEEKNWPTPQVGEEKASRPRSLGGTQNQVMLSQVAIEESIALSQDGPHDQAVHSTNGNSQESWPTPRANKVHPEITDKNRDQLANRNKCNLEEDIAGHCGTATGKLNPDWVEQLMGLPVGWTDLGSWETE